MADRALPLHEGVPLGSGVPGELSRALTARSGEPIELLHGFLGTW